MADVRAGEDLQGKHIRRTRFQLAAGAWWFDTREGVQFGPFTRRIDAASALAVFIAKNSDRSAQFVTQASERPGSQDEVANMVEEIVDVLRQHGDFGEVAAKTWARSRVEELLAGDSQSPNEIQRIQVLLYFLRYPKQIIDFECLLKSRSG